MKYLLKYSNFVPYIIASSDGFVKKISGILVEKKMKELFSQLNLLSLDFDGGVSDVNVMNRMLLFIDNLG